MALQLRLRGLDLYGESLDRLLDVLDLLKAEIRKSEREYFSDLPVGIAVGLVFLT